MRPLAIVSILCFAAGIAVIFAFCTGTSGLSLAFPMSASSLHLDVTTTGPAALGGAALTFIGALLLVLTWVAAVVGLFQRDPDAGFRLFHRDPDARLRDDLP